MYRSRSSSSVYFDALHQPDGRSWTTVDDTPEHWTTRPKGTQTTGLSLTLPRSREAPMTQNTLTSALTGSKLAMDAGIPTGANRRPLPKALQPKSARASATPSAIYGSSLGLNSPGVMKPDNFSSSLTPTTAKSPAFAAELRLGVQRMESTPSGAALSSPSDRPTDHHVKEKPRWSTLEPRPHTAGVNPPTQRPFGTSVDATGRDSRATGRAHPLASWTPFTVKPVRRREPVVQDSIVPILKAALGKDNDPQDIRIQRQEESVNRQVFGRAGKSGYGTLRTVSMYGSTDDVFGKSNSHLQLSSHPGDTTTIPRVHLKSHSDVVPPRGQFEDLQKKALRNSMSSAVSISDIYRAAKTPGATGFRESSEMERQSYGGVPTSQDLTSTHSDEHKHLPRPSSPQLPNSYGLRQTPADRSSWNDPRSTSNFVHSNGTKPLPSRTPTWESAPPLSAPPIPSHPANHPSTGWSSTDMDSYRGSWYDPIPVQPRKVIMSPSVVLDSPRNLEEPKLRSSGSFVFFGESFSQASYPLLGKGETEAVGSGEVDLIVAERNSRNTENKGTVNLNPALGRRQPASSEASTNVNGLIFSAEESPSEPSVSAQHRTYEDVVDLTVLPPPVGFRDDTSMGLTPTSGPPTAPNVNMPPLPISHQATDSMNTEDSGLERWEKDANDHSADEQDTSAGHTVSTSSGSRSSSALKKRSGSWHEDNSEGRGSLSSSPRPNNSDEHGASPTDDPYLTTANSGRFVDDKTVPSNSILRQLLAENAHQQNRNFNETSLSFVSEREPHSLQSHLDHSDSTDSEVPPLPPSAPPPRDFDSDTNESSHSYSTTVQSTVEARWNSGSTAEPGDRSRSMEDEQREHGADTHRSSASEDAMKDAGALRERYAVVSDARVDLSEALTRLTGSREMSVTAKYGSEKSGSEIGRNGGAEEMEMEGERMVFEILKGPVGVGFCIEGGKGSLSGDRPIAVKRVFKGGSADGASNLQPGDELLSIGGQSLAGLSHFAAWKCIKALPNGTFPLVIRRRRRMSQQPQLP